MKTAEQPKHRTKEKSSHEWHKRSAEIKAELDRLNREIAEHLKTEVAHTRHD